MDAGLDALVGLACPVAAYQFDLKVMQGVDVRKPVADGALQGCVAGQALLFARNQCQRAPSAVPFCVNGRENFLSQLCIAYQFRIARGQRQIAFGQHHVHVAQQGSEKRPLPVHGLQQRQRFFAAGRRSVPVQPLVNCRAKAVPARQGEPALAPAKTPGNGAEILDFLGRLA